MARRITVSFVWVGVVFFRRISSNSHPASLSLSLVLFCSTSFERRSIKKSTAFLQSVLQFRSKPLL